MREIEGATGGKRRSRAHQIPPEIFVVEHPGGPYARLL